MNLIDYSVLEILEEKYGKLYELYNMTKEEADAEIEKNNCYAFLLHDGCLQKLRTRDMGGEQIETHTYNLTLGDKPLKVGDIGQH